MCCLSPCACPGRGIIFGNTNGGFFGMQELSAVNFPDTFLVWGR